MYKHPQGYVLKLVLTGNIISLRDFHYNREKKGQNIKPHKWVYLNLIIMEVLLCFRHITCVQETHFE